MKYWNLSKHWRSPTTIFKLYGPCEILSHGQKYREIPLVTLLSEIITHCDLTEKMQLKNIETILKAFKTYVWVVIPRVG